VTGAGVPGAPWKTTCSYAYPGRKRPRRPGSGGPALPEDAGQSWVVDVVKASFDVEIKGGHFQARPLQGLHVIHEGEAGIVRAWPREGAALVRVNEVR